MVAPLVFSSTDIERLGKPIWEELFACIMLYKDTLTENEIKQFGMPTVGDSRIDEDMKNSNTYRYLTINQMVDYYTKGITVNVEKHSDTGRIYDIVSSYLLCWKQYIENGINIGGAPLDDLVALDRFATAVYAHAGEHIKYNFIDSNIVSYMSNRISSRSSMYKQEEEEKLVVPTKRESLAGLFSDRVFSNRR